MARAETPKWVLFERYCEGYVMGEWHEWITLSKPKRGGYRLRAGTSPFELRVSIPDIRTGVDLAKALEKCLEQSCFDDGGVLSSTMAPDIDDLLDEIEKSVDAEFVRAARLHLYEDEKGNPDRETLEERKARVRNPLYGMSFTYIGGPLSAAAPDAVAEESPSTEERGDSPPARIEDEDEEPLEEEGVCPNCGDDSFEEGEFCGACGALSADCALCGRNIYDDGGETLCPCVVGIYSYGAQEWREERPEFVEWRQTVRPAVSDDDEYDDDAADDPSEIRQAAEDTDWMTVMQVPDNIVHGHGDPDLYFLVLPKKQRLLRKRRG